MGWGISPVLAMKLDKDFLDSIQLADKSEIILNNLIYFYRATDVMVAERILPEFNTDSISMTK